MGIICFPLATYNTYSTYNTYNTYNSYLFFYPNKKGCHLSDSPSEDSIFEKMLILVSVCVSLQELILNVGRNLLV